MPEDKSLGSKILGLFVETGDGEHTPAAGSGAVDQAEPSAADIVAELAGTATAKSAATTAVRAGPLPSTEPAAVARATASTSSAAVEPADVDFDAVFQKAGMDSSELDRVRKAEELLRGLPEATPREVKRQIVEVSLKAVGFDIGKIVSAAQSQLRALETYVRVNEQQTAKAISDAQQQIATLEDKIIGLRADIQRRADGLGGLSAAAAKRSQQVDQVLSFFRAPAAVPPATPAPPSAKP